MAANETSTLASVVAQNEKQILPEWIELQKQAGSLQTGRITESELQDQSKEFLHLMQDGLAFQKSREDVIRRQQREITELSTPVVKLWQGVLALPIIGTLDSERTQVVMENLLQHIVDDGAEITIIDITGVPTVDTLTAQHLLKTVAAARLMGADCHHQRHSPANRADHCSSGR
jgi:anti-anti-sigma regulatory factor